MTKHSTPDFEFAIEDPPDKEQTLLYENLERAAAYPGMWARIGTFEVPVTATRTAGRLREDLTEVPPGEWDFRIGRRSDGRYSVYAKLLSDEASEAPAPTEEPPERNTAPPGMEWGATSRPHTSTYHLYDRGRPGRGLCGATLRRRLDRRTLTTAEHPCDTCMGKLRQRTTDRRTP